MMNWRMWPIGSEVIFHWEEFDGSGKEKGILTEQNEDHAIVEANGVNYWIDDDNKDMFILVK